MLNVPITPPRVAFIDARTGNVAREWYMFFLSLFQLTGSSSVSLDDLQKGPSLVTIDDVMANDDVSSSCSINEISSMVNELRQEVQTAVIKEQDSVNMEVIAWLSPE